MHVTMASALGEKIRLFRAMFRGREDVYARRYVNATPRQLAVEIDGAFHFTDAEHYRRDRRKDFLLQKNGYLVLRFLAEDVTRRLAQVIDEITAAVAIKRD